MDVKAGPADEKIGVFHWRGTDSDCDALKRD